MVSTNLMESRYGRGRRAKSDRRLAIAIGAVLGVALIGFIVWASFGKPVEITGVASGITSITKHHIDVSLTVSNPTNKAISCLVSATNRDDSSVGAVQVNLAANESVVPNLRVITVQPAVGAVVDSCWIR
jgi:hypothetical protein